MIDDLEQLARRLEAWLSAQHPERAPLAVSQLKRSDAGYSNITVFGDLSWTLDGATQQLPIVLRIQPRESSVYSDCDIVRQIEPKLRFDPRNRRLLGGEFILTLPDGHTRVLSARVLGDTGFHLGAGLYHGFDGHHHGQWRGRHHVDGEYFADCSTPESAARLNQFRDCLIEVRDGETGAIGIGNCQTWVQGAWPELGLPQR